MQTQIKNISKPQQENKEEPQELESKTPQFEKIQEKTQEISQKLESKHLDSASQVQREVTQALQSPLLQSAQELLEIKQVNVRPLNYTEGAKWN